MCGSMTAVPGSPEIVLCTGSNRLSHNFVKDSCGARALRDALQRMLVHLELVLSGELALVVVAAPSGSPKEEGCSEGVLV